MNRHSILSLFPALALLSACAPANSGPEAGSETSSPGTNATTDTDPNSSEAMPTITDPATSTGDGPGGCGPCGTLLEGDLSPTGSAAFDGFIAAADRIRTVQFGVARRFEQDIGALAEIYGIPMADVDAVHVSALVAAIQADIAAHTAEFDRTYLPARCHSDIDVAVLAQRSCETDAGCDVSAADERPPVLCEGTCEGQCDGECDGALSCVAQSPSIQCPGECLGACTSEVGAACDGTCHGDCSGQCSQLDSQGDCVGRCEGECMGTCVTTDAVQCAGVCDGVCLVNQGDAACSADASCHGECSFECLGECDGRVIPPSGAASCAFSAVCEGQAGALASAHVGCTPPLLRLEYTFQPDIDPLARGSFSARVRALELHGAAILHDAAQLGALITGKSHDVVVFDPPPLVVVSVSLAALLNHLLAAGLDNFLISEGRLPCAEPALLAASAALDDVTVKSAATLAAQAVFAAFITGA